MDEYLDVFSKFSVGSKFFKVQKWERRKLHKIIFNEVILLSDTWLLFALAEYLFKSILTLK